MLPRTFTKLYIDGRWQTPATDDTHDVVSPRNGRRIGSVPMASADDIDRAVRAARRAFDDTDWATRPVEERAAICERLAELIAVRRSEFADLIVDELGCTRFLADIYQTVAPTLHWNYYARLGREFAFSEERVADLSPLAGGSAGGAIMNYATKSVVLREPVGVVAVLCAFNFALPCVGQKAAPALVAGCTVVVKVPEPDPLAIFAMADLITEAGFPPGVLNIVAAGPEASSHLVAHEDVDLVSFTGSTAVGKQIGRVCAEQVKPCVLELGGKSAAIVLEDASIDEVVPTLVGVSVGNSQGQSCVCISRFIVPRSQYAEYAARLTAAIGALKVGDPADDDTVVGPLISAAHRERVLGYVAQGVEEGATLATGGRIPEHLDEGWYMEPTLLTDVTNDMTVAQEEIFGPVVVLIAYDDLDEAVEIANDSPYGLAGCVFTADVARGFAVARRIRTGTFAVNTYTADFNSPFGGYKQSGIGREHGVAGLEGYLQYKTIAVDPATEIPREATA